MTGQADYVASHNVFFAGQGQLLLAGRPSDRYPGRDLVRQFTNGSPSLFPECPGQPDQRPASFSSVVSNSATVRDKLQPPSDSG